MRMRKERTIALSEFPVFERYSRRLASSELKQLGSKHGPLDRPFAKCIRHAGAKMQATTGETSRSISVRGWTAISIIAATAVVGTVVAFVWRPSPVVTDGSPSTNRVNN